MDGVLCDFVKAHKRGLELQPKIAYPQSQYGFFRKLEPMKNALKSVAFLLEQDIFDVYILTAPSIYNASCYTEKREWVEMHLGMEMVKKLIISPNKSLNKGDYLIDDFTSGKGQDKFEGKLIHFGGEEFPNWDEVIGYFKKKYSLNKID